MADDRLQKALEHAHYRATLETQHRVIKLRLETELLYSESGGTFLADEKTIAFVHSLMQAGWTDAVMRDTRGTPIRVKDLAAFHEALLQRYSEAMNTYLSEWERLRRARTVKALTESR